MHPLDTSMVIRYGYCRYLEVGVEPRFFMRGDGSFFFLLGKRTCINTKVHLKSLYICVCGY
jgi:hypothetical protein